MAYADSATALQEIDYFRQKNYSDIRVLLRGMQVSEDDLRAMVLSNGTSRR